MKKIVLAGLALGLLVVGVRGNALADTITYSESYNPGTDYKMDAKASESAHNTLSWTFDIRDNQGWNTADQVFSDGTITLFLQDDSDNPTEKATFTFDGGTGLAKVKIEDTRWSGNFTVRADEFYDGLIHATLTADNGDFYFRSATLQVTSTFTPALPPALIPEPGVTLLFGLGVLGFAGVTRRRSKK
jgi:hypothetical protein